jgi:membrane carboxypeptidase/penicillin-binding protein
MRAVVNNFKNVLQNKRLEGASTITQQVAKNFLLTNEILIRRKIKEAILAFRIERAYTKERILELYLNQIYLGERTYGIAAASLEYFDKSVKELNYIEAALLAALPKAPSKYNPFRHIEEAKIRRNLVLNNLSENGYIKKVDLQKLKNQKIILKKRKIKLVNEANSYSEEVRRIINESYGFKKLYADGLVIKVPLNVNYQINAQVYIWRPSNSETPFIDSWNLNEQFCSRSDGYFRFKIENADESGRLLLWFRATDGHNDNDAVIIVVGNPRIGLVLNKLPPSSRDHDMSS